MITTNDPYSRKPYLKFKDKAFRYHDLWLNRAVGSILGAMVIDFLIVLASLIVFRNGNQPPWFPFVMMIACWSILGVCLFFGLKICAPKHRKAIAKMNHAITTIRDINVRKLHEQLAESRFILEARLEKMPEKNYVN